MQNGEEGSTFPLLPDREARLGWKRAAAKEREVPFGVVRGKGESPCVVRDGLPRYRQQRRMSLKMTCVNQGGTAEKYLRPFGAEIFYFGAPVPWQTAAEIWKGLIP